MRVFAVQGGGAKIGVLAGVLDTLYKEGFQPDLMLGVSSGALSTAARAAGEDVWRRVYDELLEDPDLEKRVHKKYGKVFAALRQLPMFKNRGFYDMSPLKKTLREYLPRYQPPARVKCGYVDFETGDIVYDAPTVDNLMASATMPGVWGLYKRRYGDGGVRDACPTRQAVREGATEIVAILSAPLGVQPWQHSGRQDTLDELNRTLGILMNEVLMNDLEGIEIRNRMHDDGILRPDGTEYRKISLTVIQPAELSGDVLDFSVAHQRRGKTLGVAAAQKFLRSR